MACTDEEKKSVEGFGMYKEMILEHYKEPHNFGKIENATHLFEGINVLCGDHIEMYLIIKDDVVSDIKFTGEACAICTTSASLLTDEVKGKSVSEILKMTRKDMDDIIQVKIGFTRVKCLMLPLKTLVNAIKDGKQ